MLAKLVETPSDWVSVLDKAEHSMKLVLQQFNEESRDFKHNRQEVSKIQNRSQLMNEVTYNQKHKASHEYLEGDYVLIKNVDTSAGVNKKLLPKFKGPLS